jgi:hypothetical protein
MRRKPLSNETLIFFLATSIFGLLTTLTLVTTKPIAYDDYFWRKPLIGSLFSAICIAGIIAAFRPNKCSERFEPEETQSLELDRLRDQQIKGHHPVCGRFSDHTITFSKRVVCAACSGLALGAFLAFLGAVSYFFGGNVSAETGKPMLTAGNILVPLGLAQLKSKGFVRLSLNVAFVCGAFLVLAGVDVLARNLFFDLFVIGLIGVWIWTRIILSEWDHIRTCASCTQNCRLGQSQLVS